MVVLEGEQMVTIGNTQYLQPDYMSPLPTTLDSKKSPLALLAQTCSQIGADSSTVKPLLANDKKKSTTDILKSPSATPKTPKTSSQSPEIKQLVFKPYELNVLSNQSVGSNKSNDDKLIKCEQNSDTKLNGKLTPELSVLNGRSNSLENGKVTPNSATERKTVSPASSSQPSASPIIRSGVDVMQNQLKDMPLSAYKPGPYGLSPMSALCCPPGMEQHMNPAFRPPYAGAYSPHSALLSSYQNAQANPFISYQRVKTPSGGETIIPVCKDPFCTGCQYSMHHQQMMMGLPCPAGCVQCEQQKYGLAVAMSQLPPGHPYAAVAQMRQSLVCNWIVGESYCGKRFGSSEELMQHLRTHTSDTAAATAVALTATPQGAAMFNPMNPMYRNFPTPPLSPLSAAAAARYHPYSKPGGIPSLGGSPYPTFNPAALGPYYPPYTLYGQRIGAAVHP